MLLNGCTTQAQPGSQGPAGPSGEQGPQGPAGVCDSNTCPQTTTVNALAGGTVTGALGVQLPTEAGPKGFTVERGAHVVSGPGTHQTSLGGFYCGKTDFDVDGTGFNSAHTYNINSHDTRGPWVAKRHCEAACGDAAAHVCSVTEFMMMQDLRAGKGNAAISSGNQNETIPWPPYVTSNAGNPNEVGGTGWIRGSTAGSSCEGLTTSSASVKGNIFQTNSSHGFIREASCDAQYPLYCCL